MPFFSPVVPRSIARAKRIAKLLQSFYPSRKLATCQATTAHLFGHKDWHALEAACKVADTKTPSLFDEQLDDDAFMHRRTEQLAMVCQELGGVDPTAEHDRPLSLTAKKSMTEPELMQHFAAIPAQSELRLERASARWSVTFAFNVIDEIAPTAEEANDADEYSDFMGMAGAEYMQQLPSLLGRWWSVNVPHQPEVGAALSAFALNPHRSTSLLKFGHYWGSLCVYYADRINWTMAMGVAYMLADRYASIFVQQQEPFFDLIGSESELTEDSIAAAMPEFTRLADFARHEFFECYPRDDFAEVFSKQPIAFVKNAGEVREILSTPGSKRGTWNGDN